MAKKTIPSDVQKWLNHIRDYEVEFKKWEGRVEKIIKRYRDDTRGESSNSQTKYNILWSNVQTLTAAVFARLPKPDVSRRFSDHDPVGRVAGTILERALDYEVQKYSNFGSALRSSVQDRFLGGRATCWVRYEPHFKAMQKQQPTDGLEITEDTDTPGEELDYECAPTDYVHWKDFGHTLARTWEEVIAVWRKVYLTQDQCIDRFGEKLGKQIPLDAKPEDYRKRQAGNMTSDESSRAMVYEIWDKSTKTAIWLSKSMNQILDTKDDPLELEEFFPCPKPIYSTLTNESLVPVPDFTLYQDQANELDILCDRIDGLVKALKVTGVYDSANGDLARLLTEGENNSLIPVKNWSGFVEKSGLKGSIDIVDITPFAVALRESYQAMEQIKNQIYDITGISDIIRGQSVASETATAQQIKGQFATLRLKASQDDVARFASDLLKIQAQIICKQFQSQTILSIAAADQLPEQDQQFIQPAMQLLTQGGPNPVRIFRIEVSSDSMAQMDEQQEKQDRTEFMGAVSQFLQQAAPIAGSNPNMVPLMGELLKFGVRGFKVGKSLESAIDAALQAAQQPQQPRPDPEAMKAQMEQQSQQMAQQHEAQLAQVQQQHDAQMAKMEQQHIQAIEGMKQQTESVKMQHEQQLKGAELAFERWKTELDNSTRIIIAEIAAKAGLDQAAARAETASAQNVERGVTQ